MKWNDEVTRPHLALHPTISVPVNKIDVCRRGPPPSDAFGGVSAYQTAGGAIQLGRQQHVRRAELAVRRDTRPLRLSNNFWSAESWASLGQLFVSCCWCVIAGWFFSCLSCVEFIIRVLMCRKMGWRRWTVRPVCFIFNRWVDDVLFFRFGCRSVLLIRVGWVVRIATFCWFFAV